MDRSCSFLSCVSRSRHRRHGVLLHEYPTSEEIRAKWVAVVRQDRREPRWTPTADSRVCSLHFGRAQFLSKRVLHARAVPSAKVAVPKFMRTFRRTDEDQEEVDTIDLDDDIPTDAEFQTVEETVPTADEEMAEPKQSDPNTATTQDVAIEKEASEELAAEVLAAEEVAAEPIAIAEPADRQEEAVVMPAVEEADLKLPAAEKVLTEEPVAKPLAAEQITPIDPAAGEKSKVEPPAVEDAAAEENAAESIADVEVKAKELAAKLPAPDQAEVLPTEPVAASGPAVSESEAELKAQPSKEIVLDDI